MIAMSWLVENFCLFVYLFN